MAEYWDSTDSLEELEEDREEDCTRIAGAFAGQNAASQVLGQEKLGATKTYDRAKVADPSASKKFHAAQFGDKKNNNRAQWGNFAPRPLCCKTEVWF